MTTVDPISGRRGRSTTLTTRGVPDLAGDRDLINGLVDLGAANGDEAAREMTRQLARFRMRYKFAIDEVSTKIAILREEFEHAHDHSPIEHVRTRLKTPDSLLAKARKIGCPLTLEALEQNIRDIAGIRVVCPFVSDVYWIMEMLGSQSDVDVVEVEDYIAEPKANGYRSLHLIIKVPVYLSDRAVDVPVELQIRTIAMDFWASVEHSIYYKYDGTVPTTLRDELGAAARTAADLDATMARLRSEVHGPVR